MKARQAHFSHPGTRGLSKALVDNGAVAGDALDFMLSTLAACSSAVNLIKTTSPLICTM
jgi:hypothetical protein